MNSYSLRFNRSKETHIYLLRSNQITYFSRKPLRKMNIMDLQNKSFAKTFSIHDHKMATSHLQPHNQQLITVTASDHQVEQTHHHTQLSARWIKTTWCHTFNSGLTSFRFLPQCTVAHHPFVSCVCECRCINALVIKCL